MRALEFIRDHVTFKLSYDSSYHMKIPIALEKSTFKNQHFFNQSKNDTQNIILDSTHLEILTYSVIKLLVVDVAAMSNRLECSHTSNIHYS